MAGRRRPAKSCAIRLWRRPCARSPRAAATPSTPGEIADEIVQELAKRGSLLTLEDFAETEATLGRADLRPTSPATKSWRYRPTARVLPRSSRSTSCRASISAKYGAESVERRHLEIEAIKLAWVLRNRHIADPGFADGAGRAHAQRAPRPIGSPALIDMERALDDPALNAALPGSDTVYLTVVDRNRHGRVLHQFDLLRASARASSRRRPASRLQNRGAGFRHRRPAIPIASAPASGRSIRSFRRWCARMAGSR